LISRTPPVALNSLAGSTRGKTPEELVHLARGGPTSTIEEDRLRGPARTSPRGIDRVKGAGGEGRRREGARANHFARYRVIRPKGRVAQRAKLAAGVHCFAKAGFAGSPPDGGRRGSIDRASQRIPGSRPRSRSSAEPATGRSVEDSWRRTRCGLRSHRLQLHEGPDPRTSSSKL